MNKSDLKIKVLDLIGKLFNWKNFRMTLKTIDHVREFAPELEQEAWNILMANFFLRKKFENQYKIVSLGFTCMCRHFATYAMLKPNRTSGEKGMPFDLAASPPKAVAHFLKTDFGDYFTKEWTFNKERNCWNNAPDTGCFYPHDKDCGPEDLEKLQTRLKGRIGNFRETMASDKPILFILHKSVISEGNPTNFTDKEAEELCNEIKRIRNGKPFKIIILACDHDDHCEKIEGADIYHHHWPTKYYTWHNPEECNTPEGLKYELGLYSIMRKGLVELLISCGKLEKDPVEKFSVKK